MSDTLLNYSVSTHPIPLAVSTPGDISVVADNPGGNSGDLATDYVGLAGLVFDFGPRGSDAPDLTTAPGESLKITPPTGWGDPVISGLRFTFTPPAHTRLFPRDSLLFRFAGIPVNAEPGSVPLTIVETAFAPGDPTQPSIYPPKPKQARPFVQLIGKFPADFSVGDLLATPPNVPAGGPVTLSWRGTPGAGYTLSYQAVTIVAHADGTPLAANDFYPDPSHGDAPFALQIATTFTLTVTYTPPGGSNPLTVQRQVSVGVNYPGPAIDSFAVTPEWFDFARPGPLTVEMTWSTSNGAGDAPALFTLTPPLSDAELDANGGDTFFDSSHTAAGVVKLNFIQPHRIDLQVTGQPGTQSVKKSLRVESTQAAGQIANSIAAPIKIVASPDGRYVFVANQTGVTDAPAVTVVSTNPASGPGAWPVARLCPGTSAYDVAVSPRGNYALAATFGGLFAIEIDPSRPPAAWAVTRFPPPAIALFGCAAIAPDESYALACDGTWLVAIHIDGKPPAAGWQFTRLLAQAFLHIAISADGRHAFATGLNGVTVITLQPGVAPEDWPITTIVPGQADNVAVSPDNRYIIYCSGGALGAIGILPDQAPAAWPGAFVTTITPTPEITFTPDGRSICLAPNDRPCDVTMIEMIPGRDPATWPLARVGQVVQPYPYPAPAIAITPQGMIVLPASGDTLQCLQIVPA